MTRNEGRKKNYRRKIKEEKDTEGNEGSK